MGTPEKWAHCFQSAWVFLCCAAARSKIRMLKFLLNHGFEVDFAHRWIETAMEEEDEPLIHVDKATTLVGSKLCLSRLST